MYLISLTFTSAGRGYVGTSWSLGKRLEMTVARKARGGMWIWGGGGVGSSGRGAILLRVQALSLQEDGTRKMDSNFSFLSLRCLLRSRVYESELSHNPSPWMLAQSSNAELQCVISLSIGVGFSQQALYRMPAFWYHQTQ